MKFKPLDPEVKIQQEKLSSFLLACESHGSREDGAHLRQEVCTALCGKLRGQN